MPVKNSRSNPFRYMIENHVADEKRKIVMSKGMTKADLEIRKFRIAVFNRTLCAIGIPIFVWLILETFFK